MRKYILVWLSSLGVVEELCFKEFKEKVFEDYYEDESKVLRENVEWNDYGNGLLSYVGDEWIIVVDDFVDYNE